MNRATFSFQWLVHPWALGCRTVCLLAFALVDAAPCAAQARFVRWEVNSQVQREWAELVGDVATSKADPTWALEISRYPALRDAPGVQTSPDHFSSVALAIQSLITPQLPERTRRQLWSLSASVSVPPPISREIRLDNAQRFWQSGDLERAIQQWEIVLHEEDLQPVLNSPRQAQLKARLMVGELLVGRPRSARRWLHAVNPAGGELLGQLGERRGPWATLMNQTYTDLSQEPSTVISPQPLAMTRRLWTVKRSQPDSAIHAVLTENAVLISESTGIRLLSMEVQPGLILVEPPPLFPQESPGISSPAACGIRLGNRWYGCVGSAMVALDLVTRSVVWQHSTEDLIDPPGWAVSGGPIIFRDWLLIPIRSTNGAPQFGLVALSQSSGETIWQRPVCELTERFDIGQHSADSLQLWDDGLSAPLVLANLSSRGLVACRAESGQLEWGVNLSPIRPKPVDPPAASCLVDRNRVYVGSRDGRVYALQLPTGRKLWTSAPAELPKSPLLVVDNCLLVAGAQLTAYDTAQGYIRWETTLPSTAGQRPLVVHSDHSVLWSTRSGLWQVDSRTGQPLREWNWELWGMRQGQVLAASASLLLVADENTIQGLQFSTP